MNRLKYTWGLSLTSQRCIPWSLAIGVLQLLHQFLTVWQIIRGIEMIIDAYIADHMVIHIYLTG